MTQDALGFLRLSGSVQRNRQGAGGGGVPGSARYQATIVRYRLGLAAERAISRDVQRRQLGVGLPFVAPGRRNLERQCRLAGVQVMASQQQRNRGSASALRPVRSNNSAKPISVEDDDG